MKRCLLAALAFLCALSPAFAQTHAVDSVFRDFNINGNAASGAYNPPKVDVRATLKQLSTAVNAQLYGAVGDGNSANAAANVAAITAINAAGRCAFLPYTAAGYNFGTLNVAISTGKCVLGENLVHVQYSGTSTPFPVTAHEVVSAPARIENITIDMAGAPSGTTGIRNMTASTPNGSVAGVRIRHIMCLNAYECIGDEASASNFVTDEEWDDVQALSTRGRQFYIRRSRGFMRLGSIRVDENSGTQSVPITWTAARFEDFIGLEFSRFDRVGPGGDTTYRSAQNCIELVGNSSSAPFGFASVWILDRLLCDSQSGNGPNFQNIGYLQAQALESFGALGNGIVFSNVVDSNVTNMLEFGGIGRTGATSSAVGFQCIQCNRVNIANLITNSNTGASTSFQDSTNVSVQNHQAFNNTGAAWAFTGTSGNILINGGAISSNGSFVSNSSTGGGIKITNVAGYNPQGPATITVTASPFTYTAGLSPETVCIFGGTVSSVAAGIGTTTQIASATGVCPYLGANESVVVTYSSAPTMKTIKH